MRPWMERAIKRIDCTVLIKGFAEPIRIGVGWKVEALLVLGSMFVGHRTNVRVALELRDLYVDDIGLQANFWRKLQWSKWRIYQRFRYLCKMTPCLYFPEDLRGVEFVWFITWRELGNTRTSIYHSVGKRWLIIMNDLHPRQLMMNDAQTNGGY